MAFPPSFIEGVVKYAEERDYVMFEKLRRDYYGPEECERSVVQLKFRFSDCGEPCPSFFQVESSPVDELIMNSINEIEAFWAKAGRYDMENLIKDEAARTIWSHFKENSKLKDIRKEAIATNNYEFYHKCIQAGAILIHDLYPDEFIFKSGRRPLLHDQLNLLWKQFSKLGKKGASVVDLCHYIVHHGIDLNECSFVTEDDLVPLLREYAFAIPNLKHIFDQPFVSKRSYPKEKPMYLEIKELTHKTKFCARWKPDKYATFLIELIRSSNLDREEEILADIREMCNLKPMPKLGDYDRDQVPLEEEGLQNFLRALLMKLRVEIPRQLSYVLNPIYLLSRSVSLGISSAVEELIQVADLYRMALGNRFLRKNHFLWAFYKSGYGLPPVIEDLVNLEIVSDDHPPYHIYVAAIKLAESLNEKKVRLEHLVFAVVFADRFLNDFHFSGRQQVIDIREQFKAFMEEVAIDFIRRFNRSAVLWMALSVAEMSRLPDKGKVVSESSSATSCS